jgi:hypothetical protein
MSELSKQNKRIIEYLGDGAWHSAWDMVRDCRTLSLTRRIYELRVVHGLEIEMEWVGKPHQPGSYTRYRLVARRGQVEMFGGEDVRISG